MDYGKTDGKDKDKKDEMPGGEDLSAMVDAVDEMPIPDMGAPPSEDSTTEGMESPAASEAVEQVSASGAPGELLAEKLGMSAEEGAALFELAQTITKYQGMSEEDLAARLLKNPYERNELEIKLARAGSAPKPEAEPEMDGMGGMGGEMGEDEPSFGG